MTYYQLCLQHRALSKKFSYPAISFLSRSALTKVTNSD